MVAALSLVVSLRERIRLGSGLVLVWDGMSGGAGGALNVFVVCTQRRSLTVSTRGNVWRVS